MSTALLLSQIPLQWRRISPIFEQYCGKCCSVYTRWSAEFRNLKTRLVAAVKADNLEQVKAVCSEIIDERGKVASKFKVDAAIVKVQGIKVIRDFLSDKPITTQMKKEMYMRVKRDAEQNCLTWQVGHGQFCSTSQLDHSVILHTLRATDLSELEIVSNYLRGTPASPTESAPDEPAFASKSSEHDWSQLSQFFYPGNVDHAKIVSRAEQVCKISIQVPERMMHLFISILAPEFKFERLP